MDENIVAVILLDETKTLGSIKPLYSTFFHFELLLQMRLPLEPFNKCAPAFSM